MEQRVYDLFQDIDMILDNADFEDKTKLKEIAKIVRDFLEKQPYQGEYNGELFISAEAIVPEAEPSIYWPQPNREDILISDEKCRMDKKTFDLLNGYLEDAPLKVVPGRMWKSRFGGKWKFCWFTSENIIYTRQIIITDEESV